MFFSLLSRRSTAHHRCRNKSISLGGPVILGIRHRVTGPPVFKDAVVVHLDQEKLEV